jgi:hypothetical protein
LGYAPKFKKLESSQEKEIWPPFVYSDEWILAIGYIRLKFHLSLKEAEGFCLSLVSLICQTQRVPGYTQICRRMKSLKLPSEVLNKRQVTDVVLDTSGLKIYGEGK